ncbi:MAG TPA: hypothetical protein VKQ52_02545 [Puia sp.]|nr:hypothetical protein [Puia sp.]
MKRYSTFLWLLLTVYAGYSQSTGGVRDLKGQSIPLDSVPSKKLLIVILPAAPDTALAGQLLRFEHRHAQQVAILCILGQGAPVLAVDTNASGYGRLQSAGIWLTTGMGAGDSAANIRQSVLKYLSNKSRNRQVDHFAEGSKYFLSEKGRLFGQLGKNTSLDNPVADYLVQTKVPGEDRF